MEPNGYTRLTSTEQNTMIRLRSEGYSLKQIAELTNRGISTVKRVIYVYQYQN